MCRSHVSLPQCRVALQISLPVSSRPSAAVLSYLSQQRNTRLDAMTPITITDRSNSHLSSIVETTPLDGRDGNSSDLKKSYGSDCDWTDGIEAMRGEQEWSRR